MINSIRTSQFDYVFANSTDYIVKKDSLRGSSILSSDEYYYNWVWVEDFTMNNDMYEKLGIPAENCIDGLDLTNEIKYDIYANNTFDTIYNKLTISRNLIYITQTVILHKNLENNLI